MTARPWLIASVGLNVFLAAGLFVAMRPLHEPALDVPVEVSSPVIMRTNVVVRRENFTWQQVESTNYAEFIKNLRSIDCPEQTIRDLIIAEINRDYTQRRFSEVAYPNYEWWKSDPDPEVVQAASEKLRGLESERRGLLTSLLGPGWDTDNNALVAARAGITLTGPVLGDLTPAVRAQALAVIAAGQEKLEEYEQNQGTANKPVDPTETVRLREEQFGQLLVIFNPQQYEEFVLRYSPAAQQLREQMRGMNLNQDQFLDVFNAVGNILGQPVFYYNGSDTDIIKQQQDLQAQSDALIKTVLGQDIYNAYKLNQDPLYRTSKDTAQQLGLTAPAVMPFYEINRATQAELLRISKDDSLNDDEKIQALAQTRVEQQQSLEQLLGNDAFQKYLQMTAAPTK